MSVWNGSYTAPLWSGSATTAKSNQFLFISTIIDHNPQIGITGGNVVDLPSTFQHFQVFDLSAGNLDLSGNLDVSGSITSLTSINAPIGNITDVESYVTVASYRVETPAILMTDTTLTAYGGNIYANGHLVGGTASNSNVSQWANYLAINNINANGCNIINVTNLSSISVNSGFIIATQGSFSNFNFSTMKGTSANISTINNSTMYVNIGWFSTLHVSSLDAPGFSNFLSNWSYYPALTDVNANNHNINNVATVNTQVVYATNGTTTQSLYVGTGGTTFSGDVRINGTGNTFSPYWYNLTMDANITTGQANQLYPPTNNQYFSDYHIGINVADIESAGAFTLAHLDMASSGWVIPTGNVTLSANNYTLLSPFIYIDDIFPYVHEVTGTFRGNAYYGTTGSGQLAYMRMNYDASAVVGKIPNQGALIEINADSYFGILANPITTSSRIAITGGRNQSFATYQNTFSAGDFGIWPVNTNICEIDMYCPIGYLGGGTTTNRVQGGVAGARNDMTAEGTLGGYGTEMNVYSTDLMYIYTNGDLYIGYGGEVPQYTPSGSEQPDTPYQHVHIAQVQDITGRTDNGDIGAELVNINSIQAYTSNAFIKNFNYLIGYDINFAYPNEYRDIPISTISTLVLTPSFVSTVTVFSNAVFLSSGVEFLSSIYPYRSTVTVSTITTSSFNYQSNVLANFWNPSTINSNLNDFVISRWNYINGISTILQGYQYKGSLVSVNDLMTSNQVVYSNTEIDYLRYPTTIVPQVPTDVYTPLDLNFAISSLTTSYQYSNATTIDDYNVTVSSTTAFYYVDSNNCYGCAFSNDIVDYPSIDNLVIVAGWSNQTGFFDVYNGGNIIPITFQSEYPNEGVTINPYTNSRTIFQGQFGDPPIYHEPITTDNLQPFYISTLYQNNTYLTQSGSNTLLEIDLTGIDVNGNPIGGQGTLQINGVVDMLGNNIENILNIYVSQINVDTIATNLSGIVSYNNTINMNYNNILNVNGLTLDNIYANTGTDVYFNNNVNFNNYGIDNCQAIRVDYIHANLNGTPVFPDGMQVDTISAYVTGKTTFNTDIDMNDNYIQGVNFLNVDYITTNANSQIDFQGNTLTSIFSLQLSHGSQILETLYGGTNSIFLDNQTVTNGNFVISNGLANPTLTFDSGKQAFIDFYENFRISSNVDMMYNDISNVGNLYATDISANNINVSTINGVVPCNQILQSGVTTAGSTVTLPIAYSGTGSYGIQLTYTGVTDTRGFASLASIINSVSEFTVWGNTGSSVFWMTIGI